MLKIFLMALLIAVICGLVMRLTPSLAARVKDLFRHPLAMPMLFKVLMRLIRFIIFRR